MGKLKQVSVSLFALFVLAISFLVLPYVDATDITLPKDTPVHVFFSPNGAVQTQS